MFGQSPNISGVAWWASGTSGTAWANGAFSVTREGTSFSQLGESGTGDIRLTLNASSYSSVYSGDKVQVSSLQALACIKF